MKVNSFNIPKFVFFVTFLCAVLLANVKSEVYFEGDILVERENQFQMGSFSSIVNQTNNRVKRAATAKKERIWDFGVVPYVIDPNAGFTVKQKTEFKEAMRHWETFTCIKFVERNASEHENFILFTILDCHCCSPVGKQGKGGQNLSIGKGCHKRGIIIHELGHAIGFWHEHTRPDRDDYVEIKVENLQTGQEHNFNKLTTDDVDTLGQPYDYGSIMHYSENTYSKHMPSLKKFAIETKADKNGHRPSIGQRDKLSPSDIQQTNKLYNCPACGRTFFDQQASFTSVNYNMQLMEVREYRCEWRITATFGEWIRLDILDLDIFESNDCTSDYLEIRDGYWHKSPLLGRFCGTKTRLPLIMSTGNRMVVTYVSIHSQHRGFVANYEAICGGDFSIVNGHKIESPNFPRRYLPNKECVWRITVPPRYQVAIEFNYFSLEESNVCANDYVEVRDGNSKKSRLIGKFCGYKLPKIVSSTSNKLYIRFVSDGSSEDGGFSAILFKEIDECKMEDHGCEHGCINTLDGHLCECRVGYKLRSDMKTCEVKCGGIINAINGNIGSIESPSYPLPYPPNEECIWEIITHNPNRITLNFRHFSLEGSQLLQEDCDYDSVTISSKYSNGKLTKHGIFCSERLPPSITSETNIMRIQFKSDKNVQKSGFSAIFSTTIDHCAVKNGGCQHICRNTRDSYECSCRRGGFVLHENGKDCVPGGCRFEITTPIGLITSPDYPKKYPKNADCVWHFKSIHGHRPHLKFERFDLEDDCECTNDHVSIYINVEPTNRDFVTGDIFTLGQFCGSIDKKNSMNLPYPISSPSDDLYMTFKSDSSIQRQGFVVRHTTVCGGHFIANHNTQYIHSHARFGDTFYENNTNCDWFIRTQPRGMRIHLKFHDFDVENHQNCEFDFVEILELRDNLNGKWASYGRFCGTNLPLEIVSVRQILLRFRTDDDDTRKGFSVSYNIASKVTYDEFRRGSNRFTQLNNIDDDQLIML